MNLRKSVAGFFAAATLVGAVIAASPASATTSTGTFDCNTHPGTTIYAAAGDTINFSSLTNCGNIQVAAAKFSAATATNGGGAVTPSTSSGQTYWQAIGITSFSITIAGGVTGNFTIAGSNAAATPPNTVVTITIASAPSPSSGSSMSVTPEPVVQQFGMPTSGSCDAAQPDGLNWAGVASGGWANSWAQWMNEGHGGAVCTRTLVYSTSLSKWTVA